MREQADATAESYELGIDGAFRVQARGDEGEGLWGDRWFTDFPAALAQARRFVGSGAFEAKVHLRPLRKGPWKPAGNCQGYPGAALAEVLR